MELSVAVAAPTAFDSARGALSAVPFDLTRYSSR
jgi:hypothetical protein